MTNSVTTIINVYFLYLCTCTKCTDNFYEEWCKSIPNTRQSINIALLQHIRKVTDTPLIRIFSKTELLDCLKTSHQEDTNSFPPPDPGPAMSGGNRSSLIHPRVGHRRCHSRVTAGVRSESEFDHVCWNVQPLITIFYSS